MVNKMNRLKRNLLHRIMFWGAETITLKASGVDDLAKEAYTTYCELYDVWMEA